MKHAIAALAVLLLAGCSLFHRADPKPVYVTVPCLKDVPVKPIYLFGKGAKPASDTEAARLLAKDWEEADLYGTAWEAAAAGCLVIPPKSN